MSSISVSFEATSYRPGDAISGTVNWQAAQADSVEIRLFWFTRGKGDTDHHTVDSVQLASPGSSGSHRFSFKLPDSPYSFSGKLISLVWAIEAFLEPSEEVDRREFTLSPNGREVVLT